MAYYKITNITNSLSKRDVFFNKTLKIEYIDRLMKKFHEIKPGEHMFFKFDKLPIGVHKMRMDGHIIVNDIGEKFFHAGYQQELEDNAKKDKENELKKKQIKKQPKPNKTTSTTPIKKTTTSNNNRIKSKQQKNKELATVNDDKLVETENKE